MKRNGRRSSLFPSTPRENSILDKIPVAIPERELTEEDKRQKYDDYQFTGDFEKDFVKLSFYLGVKLTVVHRQKIPSTPIPSANGINKLKDDKRNPHSPLRAMVDSLIKTPATYTVAKSTYEFFKPHVEIETEKPGEHNLDGVTELYLRGWLVDTRIIDVLSKTVSRLEKLTVLNMWNVGLNDETLHRLWQCLSLSPSLKELCLDGNNYVSGQKFDIFLTQTDKLSLQKFSLRNCNLNEIAAMYLAKAMLDNTSLLSLNLCFNKLGDAGAEHLAKCLRLNRTLLSLNIGSNDIGDDGAKHIADAISSFPLTHEQVVARRINKFNELKERPPSHEKPAVVSRSEKRGKRRDGNTGKGKDGGNKRDKLTPEKKSQKGHKLSTASRVERNSKSSPVAEDETFEFKNPILEKPREINGELWVPGNRSLINLSLSRNNISKVGLELLYSAIKFQIDLALETHRVVGTGLMRLALHKNHFPNDDSTYTALMKLMETRDPLYKPQSAGDNT